MFLGVRIYLECFYLEKCSVFGRREEGREKERKREKEKKEERKRVRRRHREWVVVGSASSRVRRARLSGTVLIVVVCVNRQC
jgi:hypothetical protein